MFLRVGRRVGGDRQDFYFNDAVDCEDESNVREAIGIMILTEKQSSGRETCPGAT